MSGYTVYNISVSKYNLYTANCKHPHSEFSDYNNSWTSPISSKTLASDNAYLLFYEQKAVTSN